jgi:hypothetical protein
MAVEVQGRWDYQAQYLAAREIGLRRKRHYEGLPADGVPEHRTIRGRNPHSMNDCVPFWEGDSAFTVWELDAAGLESELKDLERDAHAMELSLGVDFGENV